MMDNFWWVMGVRPNKERRPIAVCIGTVETAYSLGLTTFRKNRHRLIDFIITPEYVN